MKSSTNRFPRFSCMQVWPSVCRLPRGSYSFKSLNARENGFWRSSPVETLRAPACLLATPTHQQRCHFTWHKSFFRDAMMSQRNHHPPESREPCKWLCWHCSTTRKQLILLDVLLQNFEKKKTAAAACCCLLFCFFVFILTRPLLCSFFPSLAESFLF